MHVVVRTRGKLRMTKATRIPRLRSEMHVRGQTTVVRGHATLARLSEVIRGVSLHSLGHTSDNLGYAPRELAHPGYRWTVVDFSGTLSQTPIPIITQLAGQQRSGRRLVGSQ